MPLPRLSSILPGADGEGARGGGRGRGRGARGAGRGGGSLHGPRSASRVLGAHLSKTKSVSSPTGRVEGVGRSTEDRVVD